MTHPPSFTLYGPEPYTDLPKVSLGVQFFNNLKERKQDDIVNIDAISGETLTPGRLLEESIKLAVTFKRMGLKEGDVICIISDNNVNYFVPVLAALYIGVTIAPLNPDYTIGELERGLSLSHPKIILCSSRVLDKALVAKQDENTDIILMINEEHEDYKDVKTLEYYLQRFSGNVDDFKPDDVNFYETGAFIFLSSGTTGKFKGVFLTHENLTETVMLFYDPRYNFVKTGDSTVLVLPFFHLFGALIELVALRGSIKVILMKEFRPEPFLNAIQEHKPTKLFVVPAILLFFVKNPMVNDYDVSSITDCIAGGAPVAKTLLTDTLQRFPKLKIRQMYGLTEVAGPITVQTYGTKEGSVGILIPNAVAKVRDPDTHEVLGPMEVGELCFKGPMVMKKYVGDIAATQGVFDSDGFLRSGDIGYYNDGQFYISDRIKEMIKYKGFQVAPAELEELLLTHPAVKECAVIGVPNERAGQVPMAYVVKHFDVAEEELVDYIAARISIHKRLYGGVRFIDEIPKTPSGKISKLELRNCLLH